MKITPMMQQYLDAREKYPDTVLFFRMGDFYEMFFDDAETMHRELGLTLTARNKGDKAKEVPMAGVPHHAADGYISKLVEKGYKVAVCEQLEEPGDSKGIVRRGVTRVVTPGTVIDPDNLDAKSNNFLAALCVVHSKKEMGYGLAYLDASTGDFQVTEALDESELMTELARVDPREVLVPHDQNTIFEKIGERLKGAHLRTVPAETFNRAALEAAVAGGDEMGDGPKVTSTHLINGETVANYYRSIDRMAFRLPEGPQKAIAGVLSYLVYTQRGVSAHISDVVAYKINDYLTLDDSTRANLELTETLMGGRKAGALLHAIDRTATSMGGRRLRSWLSYPLVNVVRIHRRHEGVGELKDDLSMRDAVRTSLGKTHDIERLTAKITSGNANARDLLQLRMSLDVIPEIRDVLNAATADLLRIIAERLDPCQELKTLIARGIADDPPTALREGGIIREGYDEELDELILISRDGKDWLLRYEGEERQKTGISSLKVKYNKVFGYFIEITKANLHLVPEDYIRKQTLANAERYFTPELKEYEEKVLTAEDRRIELEYRLFEELRAVAATYVVRMRHVAYLLSTLDVLASLGEIAHVNNYVRPTMDESDVIEIEDGRHPVVELSLTDSRFVPNSTSLDCEKNQLLLITGPNMAGKSTVIRQVALIALMAQMGSFVPARSARIGVVDKIFSRVGASDNLARGHSTFMVEMTETAHILRNATSRSLIILDEIGRGTATFDGLSIAWAVAEYLHNEVGAKTLFATHYHELTTLSDILGGVGNYNIACKEWNDDIIFLRKLVPGPANRSYGIQVGRLAGLPQGVVERAKEILENLEASDLSTRTDPVFAKGAEGAARGADVGQLNLLGAATGASAGAGKVPANVVEVLDALEKTHLDTMTPIEALNLIYALKKKLDA